MIASHSVGGRVKVVLWNDVSRIAVRTRNGIRDIQIGSQILLRIPH